MNGFSVGVESLLFLSVELMEDLIAPRGVVWCVVGAEGGSGVEFVGEVL